MVQTISILQSGNDKRLYKHVKLSNGLQALLISDPEMLMEDGSDESDEKPSDSQDEGTDEDAEEEEEEEDGSSDEEEETSQADGKQKQHVKRAAAAMAVGVGSFLDPLEVQGLSHYLEHMLFMGSEKYQNENEYDEFLSLHGGSSNAFTEMEFTNYHFDVKPNRLHGALDRFAQFFIAPLCKADAMEREVQAVNNEFTGVQQSDPCRLAQLRCHTARPGHMYRKFTWGNRKSLVELPAAGGTDVRQALVQYYKDNYSAERMALVVLGGEPLDTLQAWVQELFSKVPGGRGPSPTFAGLDLPFEGGLLHVLPAVKQAHNLVVTFQLPSLMQAYLAKAEDYLSQLVGHEGHGSLLSALKGRSWASGLSAGVSEGGYERNTALYLFDVHITLTETGLNAGPGMGLAVVGLLFEYLAMLRQKGPQRWVYDELASIGAMKARFIEEEAACDYVTELASGLHMVQPQHVLLADYLYEKWDPELVESLLQEMVPSKARVDLQTSEFATVSQLCLALPNAEQSTEPWFDFPYVAAPVPTAVRQQWQRAGDAVSADLDLPPQNSFIPTDFTLRSDDKGAEPTNNRLANGSAKRHKQGPQLNHQNGFSNGSSQNGRPSAPALLVEEPGLRLWHKLDDDFRVPRAAAFFIVACPTSYESAAAAARTHLALRLLQDSLCETAYLADVAGLHYDVWPEGRSGLEVKVDGFSHKLDLLTRAVFQGLTSLQISPGSFERVKEVLVRKYSNANMDPDRHATYLRLRALKQTWNVDDVHTQLHNLDLPTVQEWLPRVLAKTHVEVLLEGNVASATAVQLARSVRQVLKSEALHAQDRPVDRVVHIPAGASYLIRAPTKNPEEVNSVAEVYFQCGEDSTERRATLDLLQQLLFEPAFNELRTKQQLGYSVSCGTRLTHNVLGFAFVIESGSHSPAHLDACIDAFLTSQEKELEGLEDEAFERHREALIARKLQRERSLQELADRHWEQISTRKYQFAAQEEEAAVLRGFTQKQILAAFQQFLLPGSPQRAKLAIHVVGCGHTAELAAPPPAGVALAADSDSLRDSLQHYPAATMKLPTSS